jgi:hypothetical protein
MWRPKSSGNSPYGQKTQMGKTKTKPARLVKKLNTRRCNTENQTRPISRNKSKTGFMGNRA